MDQIFQIKIKINIQCNCSKSYHTHRSIWNIMYGNVDLSPLSRLCLDVSMLADL